MKKILLFLSAVMFAHFSNAQSVGIGTTTPNASAILEINSLNKGLLLPRLADTSSIGSPAKGLVIYNNSNNKLWYYTGSRWEQALAGATGMDSIWTTINDTIGHTDKKYISINTDYSLGAPQANLQVVGSLWVQGELLYSKANPTAAQIYTMTNNPAYLNIPISDSSFRLYDPGGTGNYQNIMQGNVIIMPAVNQTGFKITSNAADFGMSTGDTLWISNTSFPGCRTDYSYMFTNTTTNPKTIFVDENTRFIIFRSDADWQNSKGFNFTIKRLFSSAVTNEIKPLGNALYFNNSDGSFAAGDKAEAAGRSSIALGSQSRASGQTSTALGNHTTASGLLSTAFGHFTKASGSTATAMGSTTIASGTYSTAMGSGTTASGVKSTAMGNHTTASGESSTAMGVNSEALGTSSTAIGYNSLAAGISSTAMGYNSEATGTYSTAIGYSSKAKGYASTVVGMFNDPLSPTQIAVTPTTPLFMVGNGSAFNLLSTAMVVLKNGNVGIGTTQVPEAKLHVEGGTDVALDFNSGYMLIGDPNGRNIALDDNEIMARYNGTTATLFLQNKGGALETGGSASKPGGGSWTATSDARLKQNVQPYTEGLAQLQRINPVYYNYNQQSGYDTSKQFIGVLAQDLQKVAPYMVNRFKKDNTDYLNVDNTAMTYMLINAVKEQQQKIDLLEAKLEALTKLIKEK